MRPKRATKSRPRPGAGDWQSIRCRGARVRSGPRTSCRVSTAVVQRFCKPKVGGSNPSPGIKRPLHAGRFALGRMRHCAGLTGFRPIAKFALCSSLPASPVDDGQQVAGLVLVGDRRLTASSVAAVMSRLGADSSDVGIRTLLRAIDGTDGVFHHITSARRASDEGHPNSCCGS